MPFSSAVKAETRRDQGSLPNPYVKAFKQVYRDNPMVLYVGAGISIADRDKDTYGLPDWPTLVKRIASKIPSASTAELPGDLWRAIDLLTERCGHNEEPIEKALRDIIRDPKNSRPSGAKGFKLLTKDYLDRAGSLRAVAAFCAQPTAKAAGNASYRFGPNRRLRAVISGNYDHYLEACATSMYRKEILKPVGAIGSRAGRLDQMPVFHIHGYIPHTEDTHNIDYLCLSGGLVLTRRAYSRAWKASSAYCPTMALQIPLLRYYTALFVGFSFTDKKINNLLRRIREDTAGSRRDEKTRWHYAVKLRTAEWENEEERLGKLGVKPLWVECYNEIPSLLEAIYRSGLDGDYPGGKIELPYYKGDKRCSSLDPCELPVEHVWPVLLYSRIATPPLRSIREHLRRTSRIVQCA